MVSADLFELFNNPDLLLIDESLFDFYAIIINKEGPQPTVTISIGVADDAIQIDTSRHLIDYNDNVISRPLFLVDKIVKLVFIADLQTNPQEWDQPNEDIEEFVDKGQALIERVQTQVKSLIQSGQATLLIQSGHFGTKKLGKKPKRPKPRSVSKPASVAKKQKASSKKHVKKNKGITKETLSWKTKKTVLINLFYVSETSYLPFFFQIVFVIVLVE